MQKRALFAACFFIYTTCFSQQYPFVHYTSKDGLVNSRVRKAFQDSKGRMYFMTFGGLSEYDGTRFTNYTVQEGLAADLVNDMLEMGDDSIWIACNTGALNYLHHGRIRTFRTADGFCPTINKFIPCRDGSLYVAADEGLFRFRQNRFIRLPVINSRGIDAGKFLTDAVEWKNFLLILADHILTGIAPDNLYVFDKTAGKIVAENKNHFINSICPNGNNQVYIIDDKGILQLLDTSALLKGHISFTEATGPYRNIRGVNYMRFDARQNLWLFSSRRKIIKIDSSGARKEFSTENGLSSNNFSSIFHDKEGSAWIIMDGSGADKLVNDNIEIYDKFHGVYIDNLYTDGFTDSVCLYAWSGKKFFILDREKTTEYSYGEKQVYPNALRVSAGKLYVSEGKDLFLFKLNKKPEKVLLYRNTSELSFGNFCIDPYQNVILCGTSFLTVLKGNTPVCRYPLKSYLDQVCVDAKNRLWAASRGGELFVLMINPDKTGDYLELLKNYDKGLPSLAARSLVADRLGNIWVGTRNDGLYCFRIDDRLDIRSIQHYTVKDGLSDNFINYLTCDNENNIWASNSSGVDKITYADNKIHIENITRNDNIYEQVFKTLVAKDGIAWSYTSSGKLIRIGKSHGLLPYVPSLLITGLKINNVPSDSLSGQPSFSYRQNSFSISVAAPSFYNEQQVKYSYLLEGSSNNQWSEPSFNSTFNFINLNPGKYDLKIKAAFPGNRYPDSVIGYTFIIRPPWWQTWWFRIIAALSVIGLLWAGIVIYYRNKLERQRINAEKQQAVEKERTRIATDIHDDLGSGLSRIRYLGEMVKLKTMQQQNILPDIEKIAVFSDEMVDKMNEIVWALNEKNDSLESIIAYTRSFAAEYLSNSNLMCTINLPDEIPYCIIKGETRRNIFLSVKECLHNIVKHAGASEVTLTFFVNDYLVIRIHDDGHGINWENIRPFSNGILNLKQRMKDAGGMIDFKNEKGTTVVLKIPL